MAGEYQVHPYRRHPVATRQGAARHDGGVIETVRPGSLAEELGLRPGDRLLSINGRPVTDYVGYKFDITAETVELHVARSDGEEWLIEVEKDEDEDLGVTFVEDLFDGLKKCHNACAFCFLNQMPAGMRPTLYLPDDDFRLSFLHGNFVTLTNLREEDFERIISQRLSPLYVSVHATNPAVRRRLMINRKAGRIMEDLRRLARAGIDLHTQLVLCPGVNDGPELDRSIADLAGLFPRVLSIAAVPVGLTRFREGLTALRPYRAEEAARVIGQVEGWQRRLLKDFGRRMVHASDEFYVLAGRPMPAAEAYEGFPQLENGVGLLRVFMDEFRAALAEGVREPAGARRVTVVTGRSAAPTLGGLVSEAGLRRVQVNVVAVENAFFGPTVTVTGLLTGRDIVDRLRAVREAGELGDVVLLPQVLVRELHGDLLDGMRPEEIGRAVGAPVRIVPVDGSAFLRNLVA